MSKEWVYGWRGITGRYTGAGSKAVCCKCGGRVGAWVSMLWYQSIHTNVFGCDDADGVFL
jgi:hypothetical protein